MTFSKGGGHAPMGSHKGRCIAAGPRDMHAALAAPKRSDTVKLYSDLFQSTLC